MLQSHRVAAKAGGGDPSMNLTLRYAIEDAGLRICQRTTSPGPSNGARGNLVKMLNTPPFATRVTARNGVAFVVDTLTENVNRTAPQIRSIFDKAGGNMGKPGSVSFGFDEVVGDRVRGRTRRGEGHGDRFGGWR